MIFLKGEIIKKPGKIELWFFDTALLFNALYHCMKFEQIISKGFQVMLRTRQLTDRRTYSQYGTYVTFPLIFLANISHTRLKKRHTSKNRMNRIKENLLLPIVLQVTQVPLGSY
jgi:hypothetical protein